MAMCRSIGFSLLLLAAPALILGLPGCGGGGAGTSGPAEVIKNEPVRNEKGEVIYSIDDEAKPPTKPAK